jgi:hypothetical protein
LNQIDPALIRRNDYQGVRGISIATDILDVEPTDFGKQMTCPAGFEIGVRLLAVGATSISLLPIVLEAMNSFGKSHGLGYQAPVKFTLEYASVTEIDRWLDPTSFSLNIDAGTLPELSVQFEAPLILKSCVEKGRLIPPTFHELLNNSVRIVNRSIREFHDPSFLQSEQFHEFLTPAKEIISSHNCLIAFQQGSISHRGSVASEGKRNSTPLARDSNGGYGMKGLGYIHSSRREENAHHAASVQPPTHRPTRKSYSERSLRAWLGSITFRNVPVGYLPWLYHAGQLGIGSDRNRGAGLWRVELG